MGSISIDDVPITTYELSTWQKNLGVVSQDTFLFNGTIAENLAFGSSSVSSHDIHQACEIAQAHQFISNLPDQYQTVVGERGYRLSGGQRQRLSLARAILRDPQLLILDEATSALDNRTESEVINALEVVGRRCTMIVIAHRLSTIARCDRIYEIEGGEVKAFGTFEELQDRSVTFQDLAYLERLAGSSKDE